MKKPNKEEVEKLFEEVKKGLSYKEAGRRYEVSDNAIRKRFKTAKFYLPEKKVFGKMEFTCAECGKIWYREYNDFLSWWAKSLEHERKTGEKLKKAHMFCSSDCKYQFQVVERWSKK